MKKNELNSWKVFLLHLGAVLLWPWATLIYMLILIPFVTVRLSLPKENRKDFTFARYWDNARNLLVEMLLIIVKVQLAFVAAMSMIALFVLELEVSVINYVVPIFLLSISAYFCWKKLALWYTE